MVVVVLKIFGSTDVRGDGFGNSQDQDSKKDKYGYPTVVFVGVTEYVHALWAVNLE